MISNSQTGLRGHRRRKKLAPGVDVYPCTRVTYDSRVQVDAGERQKWPLISAQGAWQEHLYKPWTDAAHLPLIKAATRKLIVR